MTTLSWLFGVPAWLGVALVVVALFIVPLGGLAKWLVAALLAATMGWGVLGHVAAAKAERQIKGAVDAKEQAEARATLRKGERDAALAAADQCSRSVAALAATAEEQRKAGAAARTAAHARAVDLERRAAAVLAAPPAHPGDDYASARARAWGWLAERGPHAQ